MLRRIAVIATLFSSGFALAESIDPGIAYKCDERQGAFVLTAIMETSSPEYDGEIPIEAGFRVLSKDNDSTNITCSIKSIQVSVDIERYPPRERGQCSAYNHFMLRRLQVNDDSLLKDELFNSGCFLSPVLYRIEVHARPKAYLFKTCMGQWDWGEGYRDGKCKNATIPLTKASTDNGRVKVVSELAR